MLSITDGEQPLGVVFQHVKDDQHKPHSTVCVLMAPDKTPLASAMATCHTLDQYNRAMGRKLAFQRAVECYTVDYHKRRALWESFLATGVRLP